MQKSKLNELVEKLNTALKPRGVICPMCGNIHFSVVEGMLKPSVQNSLNSFQIGGTSIPCVAIVCNKCGFISQHAIGVLDPDFINGSSKETNKEEK